MLATGASLVKAMQFIKESGNPSEIHIACALACTVGLEYVQRAEPKATIWCGDIDDELTAKGYIVPGLGRCGRSCLWCKSADVDKFNFVLNMIKYLKLLKSLTYL